MNYINLFITNHIWGYLKEIWALASNYRVRDRSISVHSLQILYCMNLNIIFLFFTNQVFCGPRDRKLIEIKPLGLILMELEQVYILRERLNQISKLEKYEGNPVRTAVRSKMMSWRRIIFWIFTTSWTFWLCNKF